MYFYRFSIVAPNNLCDNIIVNLAVYTQLYELANSWNL